MRDAAVPAASIGVGVLLAGGGLAECALRLTDARPLTTIFLAGLVTSLPFNAVAVAGGVRLRRGELSPRWYDRVGLWTAGGAAFFVALIGLFTPVILDTPLEYVGAVRWSASVGTGAGFLIGYATVRVTERTVAAERAAVRAEEADERRELLAYLNALLRHEVLNTANVIEGQASLLATEVDDERVHERTAVISRRADELGGIIEDVRTLVRATDEAEVTRPTDVTSVLRETIADVRDRGDPIEVETTFPDEARVPADGLLNRLFGNLLVNGVEHDDDPPTRLTVTVSTASDRVTVRIADDGPGVPPDLRDELFDPGVSRRDDDSRLGTVIVGRLAERYDGRVELVETGPDGTTIEVTLPRARAADDAAAVSAPSETDQPPEAAEEE